MVTEEQLRKLYYAEPFQPFVFVFDDGRRIKIDEPYSFMIAGPAKKIGFSTGDGLADSISFDRVTVVMSRSKAKRRPRKAS